MVFYSQRLIKPEDVNLVGRPFVGRLLDWVKEEASLYAGEFLGDQSFSTKRLSGVDFIDSVELGDEVEFGLDLIEVDNSSLTVSCIIFNKKNRRPIIAVNKIVFVSVDMFGLPKQHGIQLEQVA